MFVHFTDNFGPKTLTLVISSRLFWESSFEKRNAIPNRERNNGRLANSHPSQK